MIRRRTPGSGEPGGGKNKSLTSKRTKQGDTQLRSKDSMAGFLLEAYGERAAKDVSDKEEFLALIEDPQEEAEFVARWASESESAQNIARKFTKPTKTGKALEAFLGVEISTADWFEASTIPTVFSDDVHNKVDLVLEWDTDDGEIIRLGVDLATSEMPERIMDKANVRRNGTKVEFFMSDLDSEDPGKRLIDLPRIILGVDASMLPLVAKRASEKKRMKTVEKVTKDYIQDVQVPVIPKNAFAGHPLQLMLLDQASVQMNLHVRSEAARVLKKFTASHAKKPLDGMSVAPLNEAIKRAIDSKSDGSSVDEVIEIVDEILKDHPTQSGKILGARHIEKWKNWKGCRNRIEGMRNDVIEKIPPPDRETVRGWEKKSTLHQTLVQFVRDAA